MHQRNRREIQASFSSSYFDAWLVHFSRLYLHILDRSVLYNEEISSTLQSNDLCRTLTDLVQHSASRGSSHRRNGVISHMFNIVCLAISLAYRSSIVAQEGGLWLSQIVPTYTFAGATGGRWDDSFHQLTHTEPCTYNFLLFFRTASLRLALCLP